MDRVTIDPSAIDPTAIARAAAVLAAGGLVAYPTDTFYGLAADPRNVEAVRKLFDAKGRSPDQASPLIAATSAQAEQAVEFTDAARILATHFWPGPLSLVLPARPSVQRAVLGGGETAAVRVPDHSIARALAGAAGFCITATSANRSGGPPAQLPNDIDARAHSRTSTSSSTGARRPGWRLRRSSISPTACPGSSATARSRGTAC